MSEILTTLTGVVGHRIDRRTTLKWLAASLAFSAHHGKVLAGTFKPSDKGYGTDPDLFTTKATWDRLLTERELRQAAILADLILPGTDSAPAPSAIGVHEFIDEWVSAPYPDQLADRAIIRPGLAWLDGESVRRFQKDFLDIGDPERCQILDAIAAPPTAQTSIELQAAYRFFKHLRFLVVASYYTSDDGMKDVGYSGNVALEAFPPATDETLAIIERECAALGI